MYKSILGKAPKLSLYGLVRWYVVSVVLNRVNTKMKKSSAHTKLLRTIEVNTIVIHVRRLRGYIIYLLTLVMYAINLINARRSKLAIRDISLTTDHHTVTTSAFFRDCSSIPIYVSLYESARLASLLMYGVALAFSCLISTEED
jgi:hypothetical protein